MSATTDRLNVFRQEAQRLGIKVVPPDVNRSEPHFACDAEAGAIYYALAAVKGVGRQAMEHLVATREAGGAFRSIGDFARRIDPKLINKRAFESLVRAGAFDCLSSNRRQLVEFGDAILDESARNTREREMRAVDPVRRGRCCRGIAPCADADDWLPHERLSEEFGAIGLLSLGPSARWL